MATTGIPSQVEPGTENLTDRLRSALSRLSNQQKILLMIAVAIIAALLVAGNTWLKQADYRILFSNISERDGGAIIAALLAWRALYYFLPLLLATVAYLLLESRAKKLRQKNQRKLARE